MRKITVFFLALTAGTALIGCQSSTTQAPTDRKQAQSIVAAKSGTLSSVQDSVAIHNPTSSASIFDRNVTTPKWDHSSDARTRYPGYPAQITVSKIDSFSQQEGGGTWLIWVSADVRDLFSRPVADRYSVAFSVTPSSIAQTGLDTAATYNTGPNNRSTQGVAYAQLSYQGQNTFDTVTVTASCYSRDSRNRIIIVSNSLRFALPLQQGAIQVNFSPNTFLFTNPSQISSHMAWVVVYDGYGLPIHAAPITLHSSRLFYRTFTDAADSINGLNFVHLRTGNYTGYTDPNGNGSATIYMYFRYTGVFSDTLTAEITNELQVTLDGYSDIIPGRLVMNFQHE